MLSWTSIGRYLAWGVPVEDVFDLSFGEFGTRAGRRGRWRGFRRLGGREGGGVLTSMVEFSLWGAVDFYSGDKLRR